MPVLPRVVRDVELRRPQELYELAAEPRRAASIMHGPQSDNMSNHRRAQVDDRVDAHGNEYGTAN